MTWSSVDWTATEAVVRRIQDRIFRAAKIKRPRLEPDDEQSSCPVLRGLGSGNGARLPDPIAAENVRDAIGDLVPKGLLALGRYAARPQRVRVCPGARGVNHRPRQVSPCASVRLRDRQSKRASIPASGQDLVSAVTGDPCYPRAGLDHGCHFRCGREGYEIAVHEFEAGRKRIGAWLPPAVAREQGLGRLIDVVAPRRKQPHMAPIAYMSADRFA